jgi:hypothetical protein
LISLLTFKILKLWQKIKGTRVEVSKTKVRVHKVAKTWEDLNNKEATARETQVIRIRDQNGQVQEVNKDKDMDKDHKEKARAEVGRAIEGSPDL